MKKILLVLFFLSFATLVQAGNLTGKVKNVRIDRSGLGIIEFYIQISSQAGCVSPAYLSHFSFDANTAGGKAIYSMALTAVASGRTMAVIGINDCLQYTNIIETISYAHIYDF